MDEYGRVVQINVKPEAPGERGLPKIAVPKVNLGFKGFEGDYNKHRAEKFNSDPDMAVLIWTVDKIRDLRNEGWPVGFGHLGENFTVHGLKYEYFKIGEKYSVGEEAIIRISGEATPCKNLVVLPYVGEERKKEFIKTLVGRRGWYASVIDEGEVRTGDVIKRIL